MKDQLFQIFFKSNQTDIKKKSRKIGAKMFFAKNLQTHKYAQFHRNRRHSFIFARCLQYTEAKHYYIISKHGSDDGVRILLCRECFLRYKNIKI